MAATFGGPPIRRIVSGSMFCSLKKPFSSATKYGSDELTGNTPTLTLSCAAARQHGERDRKAREQAGHDCVHACSFRILPFWQCQLQFIPSV